MTADTNPDVEWAAKHPYTPDPVRCAGCGSPYPDIPPHQNVPEGWQEWYEVGAAFDAAIEAEALRRQKERES